MDDYISNLQSTCSQSSIVLFIFVFFFVFKVIYSAMFLNVYSISDCVIPWASMKVINRHSCPIHLPSHTAGGWASTTFRRAKDCGRKEPGSTRVGEGDCGENDQGLKEALELVKLTKSSQQNRYCSLQEFENLSGCYHWSLIGGIQWMKARNARCSATYDLILLTKTHSASNRTFECSTRHLSG